MNFKRMLLIVALMVSTGVAVAGQENIAEEAKAKLLEKWELYCNNQEEIKKLQDELCKGDEKAVEEFQKALAAVLAIKNGDVQV